MKKNKIFSFDFLIILFSLLALSIILGISYLFKKIEFISIGIFLISLLISNFCLNKIENESNKKYKNDKEIYEYLMLNNYQIKDDLRSNNQHFNSEIIKFTKTIVNGLIEPYLYFFNNLYDLRIKEIILNLYLLKNSKKENKEIKINNLILLKLIQINETKKNDNSILLISYILLIILLWLFLIKVFIK